MSVHELVFQALRLMGVGFTMVFAVLAIFYGLVKALMFIFPADQNSDED